MKTIKSIKAWVRNEEKRLEQKNLEGRMKRKIEVEDFDEIAFDLVKTKLYDTPRLDASNSYIDQVGTAGYEDPIATFITKGINNPKTYYYVLMNLNNTVLQQIFKEDRKLSKQELDEIRKTLASHVEKEEREEKFLENDPSTGLPRPKTVRYKESEIKKIKEEAQKKEEGSI